VTKVRRVKVCENIMHKSVQGVASIHYNMPNFDVNPRIRTQDDKCHLMFNDIKLKSLDSDLKARSRS
jgi:hypothetical protein